MSAAGANRIAGAGRLTPANEPVWTVDEKGGAK